MLTFDAMIAAGTTCVVLLALVFTRISAAAIFVGAMTLLLLLGVIDTKQALAGFSNPGVITIAALYVVAAGLRNTGAIALVTGRLFGRGQSERVAQLRIMAPVSLLSAFMNNTPVVATFVPAITDWARKNGFSASRFLLPLSYAAIIGGTMTLIGTSTNLIVNGLLLEETGSGFHFFELAWLGLPSALIAFIYVFLFGRKLLPKRKSSKEQLAATREYTVEMLVEEGSPLVGQSIEAAGLRHLPGLFLIELDRANTVLPAVDPEELLQENDRLVFAGIVDSIADLQKIKGLVPATEQVFKLDADRSSRALYEVVIGRNAGFVHKTVKASGFRKRFDAVVIAVSREGERINRKIGDITLHPGDTLLLESDRSFAERNRGTRDFLLVKPLEGQVTPNHERAGLAWAILAGVVASAGLGLLEILHAALAGAGLMVVTRCLDGGEARRSLDIDVLVVIAAAFALGAGLESTGAAASLAYGLLGLAGNNPLGILLAIYVSTVLLTEVLTNNAAAVLMFPIAHAMTASAGLNFMPFAVAIAFAASASLSTPIGYQTNLMVYGPGGYRFGDYLRFGLPLNAVLAVTAMLIIPQVWPLS
ncbi:MAG: SLC13 family permease [Gammaproteobacteria bacterium]|nr:SLC13 family permease [Gammaproteobacteria bacterium]